MLHWSVPTIRCQPSVAAGVESPASVVTTWRSPRFYLDIGPPSGGLEEYFNQHLIQTSIYIRVPLAFSGVFSSVFHEFFFQTTFPYYKLIVHDVLHLHQPLFTPPLFRLDKFLLKDLEFLVVERRRGHGSIWPSSVLY